MFFVKKKIKIRIINEKILVKFPFKGLSCSGSIQILLNTISVKIEI